ncbi:hypothetical protein U1Q18_010935 [Sarracenia purpurea var. burkii]
MWVAYRAVGCLSCWVAYLKVSSVFAFVVACPMVLLCPVGGVRQLDAYLQFKWVLVFSLAGVMFSGH